MLCSVQHDSSSYDPANLIKTNMRGHIDLVIIIYSHASGPNIQISINSQQIWFIDPNESVDQCDLTWPRQRQCMNQAVSKYWILTQALSSLSQTVPKLVPDSAKAFPRQCQILSQTMPKLVPDGANACSRQSKSLTQAVPTFDLCCAKAQLLSGLPGIIQQMHLPY